MASHTFTVCGPEKPATFTAIPVGVCTLPYTPRVTVTTAPSSSGTYNPAAETLVRLVCSLMPSSLPARRWR
ncbi:hypothetical protein GCM10009661_37390 [Catellatospora chokoriensis]